MKRGWREGESQPAPLDARVRALVEADGRLPVPSELRERVLRRARATTPPRYSYAARRAIAEPRRTWSVARAAAAVTVVLASGAAGAAVWRMFDHKADAPLIASMPPRSGDHAGWRLGEAPSQSGAGAHGRNDERNDDGVPAAEPQTTVARRRPAVSHVARLQPPGDPEEVAILDRARAAIARGSAAEALAPLAEHARRFPRGRLAEEREALRVRALSGTGRTEEARQAAAAFRARFPDSVLLPRVEALAPTRQ